MKVPPKRKGNYDHEAGAQDFFLPSMKVPPKRKGNFRARAAAANLPSLNESPSEKEGKFGTYAPRKTQKPSLNESPSEKEGKSETICPDDELFFFSPQ